MCALVKSNAILVEVGIRLNLTNFPACATKEHPNITTWMLIGSHWVTTKPEGVWSSQVLGEVFNAVKFLAYLIEGHRSTGGLKTHQSSVVKLLWFIFMVVLVVVYPWWGTRPGFVVENMNLASFLWRRSLQDPGNFLPQTCYLQWPCCSSSVWSFRSFGCILRHPQRVMVQENLGISLELCKKAAKPVELIIIMPSHWGRLFRICYDVL